MAKKEKEVKTNVMRLLEQAGIQYEHRSYPVDEEDLSGRHAADLLGIDHRLLYKTLVLHGDKSGYFVCVIPVDEEIDLKKTARISGNKKAELIAMKELLPLTGYVRGGCSPIGMKKAFPTYIHIAAEELETIGISAGMRGEQVILSPKALADYVHGAFEDLTSEA